MIEMLSMLLNSLRRFLMHAFFCPFVMGALMGCVMVMRPTMPVLMFAVVLAALLWIAGCAYEAGGAGVSNRPELLLALFALWCVVHAMIRSSPLFAYLIELPDGTHARCLTTATTTATAWMLVCSMSGAWFLVDSILRGLSSHAAGPSSR